MAGAVIADAGPLIAFAKLDRLSILRRVFSTVTMTESVRMEYSSKTTVDRHHIDAAIAERWLLVEHLDAPATPLSPSLGIGESDSIRLAMRDPDGSLLIIDDRLARRYALRNGLNIIGSVRVLDLAERCGIIGSAEHIIQEMAAHGYRISPAILAMIRRVDSMPSGDK